MQKYILSVTVQNNAGVLARVSSLFGRRGYNIDSLTVSATTDPKISRMSIIVQGDEPILEQIIKQLLKLEEVMRVDHLQEDESCCSELVFVKLRAESGSTRDDIRQLCGLYDAHIVETSDNAMIVELSDVPSRIDAFLDVVSNFEVIEMSRSGVTAIQK
ncbi:acetolactate synthase small subunit [Agathobaculum sp.]|uniref:acetolactate synthase small subunit n=1 Tax=Agathobaculum sp. TaxID=2048138 RepID=UPI001C3BC51F|nr:acetolactate synthase small subunit [Agathobaculum sp.]MBS6640949.1 acetolactate synthase small subunit [Clostridiaceae bacterium]HIX10566.1 acetolactate synthase small subunit [Candidatus Agathobaculum pullistercoris]